ncbi:MAG: ribosomal protein S18-alanine N-acetyltransferase [Oscillospiraceae bacterium]
MMIRKAGPEDVPVIAALEEECFSEPWPEAMIGRLRERFTVALEEETVAGYLVLSTVLDEGNIDNVAVSPAYRRRGIADALVENAVTCGRESGLAALMLEVRASNIPAIRLYEKHGFEAVGRRKNYYTKPREDAILMTLVL